MKPILRLLTALLFALPAVLQSAAPAARPNIVFILVDDLGYSDVGCYGSDYYATPHIDRLARQGMRFTQAYAASCLCSPTRSSLMTGKYPGRLHITHAIPIEGHLRMKDTLMRDADYVKNMPLEEVTIAEALKEGGYATAFMGKWHCCWDKAFYPEHQGFDLNVGGSNMGSPARYFSPYEGRWRMTEKDPWVPNITLPAGPPGEYLTDRLTDEAIKYVKGRRDQPFFLYLAHYAVHTPLQAKEDKISAYKAKPTDKVRGHTNATYAAMIESVDESVGRILKTLDELDLARNTIVVLTSDNGGFYGATSNYPWRGNKGNFYEGGIRVPAIVKWPGVTVAGSVSDEMIISPDFYPTLLDMALLPPKPAQHVDGLSFASVLRGSGHLEREAIYWHFPNYTGPNHRDPASPCTVIRQGDWKMFESLENGSVQLYNLKADPKESTNLAIRDPERVAALRALLFRHRVEIQAQYPRPKVH